MLLFVSFLWFAAIDQVYLLNFYPKKQDDVLKFISFDYLCSNIQGKDFLFLTNNKVSIAWPFCDVAKLYCLYLVDLNDDLMNKVFIALLFFLSCFWGSIFAAIPLNYYSGIEGKQTAVLKTALHDIICKDTSAYLKYGSGTNHTWQGFYSTDRDTITNLVLDMYSDSLRYFPDNYVALSYPGFGQSIHIEHSVPKSWWGCDIDHPDCAAEDLNHLFPADGKANISKNDNPLGVVTGVVSYSNGVSKIGYGSYTGYSGTVFEPADKFKGDFARAYFYMATAYEHYVNKWDTSKPENMMEHNTYPVLKQWAINLLLQWHRQDTVSQKERTRQEKVFTIQHNRNPFIDYPDLVEYIWGSKAGQAYSFSSSTGTSSLEMAFNSVTSNTTLQFIKNTSSDVSRVFLIKCSGLQGDVTITKSGTDATSFVVSTASITQADATVGKQVTITYAPSQKGSHTAYR